MRDVVVVGAGPAGLHAAYRLASAGLDVLLLEARTQVGEAAICAGVIGEDAFTRFGLPTRSVLASISCIQAISPAGRALEHQTTAPLARVVDKGQFNRDLADRASSVGTEIWPGRYVESIQPEKQSVVLHFRTPEQGTGTLRTRVAVIASGVNFALNKILGLAKPREFLHAIQADVSLHQGGDSHPTQVYVGRSVAPGAFGWNIPLGHGRARIGIMTTALDPRPFFDALIRRIAPGLGDPQVRLSPKAIAQAPVGRCATERILAIGEAAGHVKTSTGGGIHYGLLSAELAAEVILRAFHESQFSIQTFGEFERYWRRAFGSELVTGYFARKLAASFSDSQIENIFDRAKAMNLLARLDGSLQFDWHHRAILTSIRSLITPSSVI